MLEKLAALAEKFDQLTELVSDPAIIADQPTWQKHVKARAELEEVVEAYREYQKCLQEIREAEQIIAEKIDRELAEMAELELEQLKGQLLQLEQKLHVLLLPKDPNDEKNVIIEVRAGTGGDEAGLFAADLFKMYCRYAERQNWHIEIMEANYSDLGGVKEIIVLLEGRGAYSRLKFESGVHRVQRVPETESSGRIHTSAATVAVLPEAEEVEVDINPNDLRIDVFCSSGPGGQSVNTTQSAVRIIHIPTGLVVSCQDEKSQHKNKDKALRVLRARLLEKMQEEAMDEEASSRKSMVGSGDRSERIRTYNFPQGRVTDHRIGLTLHRLEWILQGDLDEIIDSLITSDQAQRLKEG
ncbi:MAG: peptide chain release factor 1 [Clostridiales bacterium]|jgi:peptide chain release factor 1|nr:peptide chain release factor 1 [Clostridiales bacterium]MDR2712459.1 peptide chain release factor 1 [Clostridiales bacterium]